MKLLASLSKLRLAAPACLLIVLATTAPSGAQERVIDKRPFDQIELTKSAGGKTLSVLPLRFPNRRVPSPFPSGRLTVQLTSKPGTDYLLSWTDIASIKLYEQLILEEAEALTRQKKFNEAFDYFAFLNKNYPNMPGLAAGTGRYLQANALDAYREKQYDLALAMLISLFERDPNSPGLGRAVDTVAGKIIGEYKQQRNWRAARSVLDVVDSKFKGIGVTVVDQWRRQFKQDADQLVQQGAVAYRNKDYRAARTAATAATAILPDHPTAARLMELVEADFPTIVVGVRTLAPAELTPRLDSPESLRTSRLAQRTITELSGYSPEGGVYTCPLGRVALDESGVRFGFSFPPPIAEEAPFAVARELLRMATPGDPAYDRAFASVTESVGVEVDRRGELAVDLSRPHIRPEALLRHTPLRSAGLAPTGMTFNITQATADRMILSAAWANAPIAEVEERYFDQDDAALEALARGDIHVLDRVMPWQLEAVRSDRNLAVGSYDLPTVHVLVPTHRNKLLDSRSLRRALLYGINRQKLLDELILAGRDELGYQLVSGPFPSGRSLSDPIHYGYNDGVQARPYDPRLGALLAALTWAQSQREEHGKEDQADRPFPTLTLAHSSDPIARAACQSIQMQLGAIGVPIKLKELPAAELLSDNPDFDLRYAELAMWEPLVDAERLLGPGGIAARCSDPMIAALERLDNASNWPDVSTALRDIHELAAGDLPVLPLWQTVNFYAFRRDLKGITDSAVALYQTIEGWTP